MSQVTAIGRPIDPRYPTNLAIAIGAVVVAAGGTIVQRLSGERWAQSALWGLGAGLAVFLAWALCRELDPDNDLSAFVAAGLALVGLWLGGLPGFGELFWLLLITRIVNRTTGLPATVLDALGVLGLGGWLTFQGKWGYGAFTVVALLLDAQLPPRHRRQLLFAGLGVVVVVLAAILGPAVWGPEAVSLVAVGIALVGLVLFVPVIAGAREVTSLGDETEEPLRPIRVQAGQALALLTGLAVALWQGMAGLETMMPLWAAVVGAALYRLLRPLGGSRKKHA